VKEGTREGARHYAIHVPLALHHVLWDSGV